MTLAFYVLRNGNIVSTVRTHIKLTETRTVIGPLHSLPAALYAMTHDCPASAGNRAAQIANAAIRQTLRAGRRGRAKRVPAVPLTLWSACEWHDGQQVLVVRELDGVPTHVAVGGAIYAVPERWVRRIRDWPRFRGLGKWPR